jgi:hypothetical protein
MTRWPKYLHRHSLIKVALLASPANTASELLLVEFSDSLDRIVKEAHALIQVSDSIINGREDRWL